MNQEDSLAAISAVASEALASGESASLELKALAAKVIALVEKRNKGEDVAAILREARTVYGLPSK